MQGLSHDVVIAGGGPTGLMLAGELALAGVDVAIIERRPNQDVEGSRAGGLHPRSLELLDQRGLADGFLSEAEKHHVVMFAGAMLDASDRASRFNYTLGVWQAEIERGLADWTSALGVRTYFDAEVVTFAQDADRVAVDRRDGRTMHARYLVGCDGGRSVVRKTAGIDFPGWDADISYLIFEAGMEAKPAFGIRHGERGLYALGPLDGGARVRGVVTEPRFRQGEAPDLAALKEALIAAYGTDFGVHEVTWLSRFTDAARQAATWRAGRVLLAGDAAHIHSPAGGQGLQMGLQDAVNLGWKLAQVIRGLSPDRLLDTYEAERRPVTEAVLRYTLAMTALNRGDDRTTALREMMARMVTLNEARRWYADFVSGLDVRYDLGEGSPLLGRRMPDLDISTAEGPTRILVLLREGRPVLLNFADGAGTTEVDLPDRVMRVDARSDAPCEVPGVGVIPLPEAVLIRPDGHVAWTGRCGDRSLMDACRAWFGRSPEDA